MSMRESSAINIAPLFLRLALAATFIWAGLGKVLPSASVSAAEASELAEVGVTVAGAATPQPDPQPDPQPETPDEPLPEPDAGDDEASDEDPEAEDPADLPAEDEPVADDDESAGPAFSTVALRRQSQTPASAGEVKALHKNVTLTLKRAAEPSFADNGEALEPIVPAWVGRKPWTQVLAWAAAIIEIGAGALVLIGLFTRLAALGLAGTMAGAMWLTEIGPAIQTGAARYGFLPGYDVWSYEWITPLFQLICGCAALALLFSGAGAMSVDRLLFKPNKPSGKG